MEAIISVVVESVRSVFSFTYSVVDTFASFKDNVKALQDELTTLSNKKAVVENEINVGRVEGMIPTAQVVSWLVRAEKAENDVRPLLREGASDEEQTHCCNMLHHYHRCKGAREMVDQVKQLIASCPSATVESPRNCPANAVEEMPTMSLVGQAASDTLQQIFGFLNDEETRRIAVWGMGGVGKTTLVKNLNNALFSFLAGSFDLVIWVDVSRDLDLRVLQTQIATRLNLKLVAGETTRDRATRLLRRLKMRKKLLLIFDDVWEKIDLDMVGIPTGKAHPCCKILLTTRSNVVCREMMIDSSIKVDVLSEEDAWNLFSQSAGSVVESEGIEPLAQTIAKECCGLPLAIKTLATSMRGSTNIELWQNALFQLQRSTPLCKSVEIDVFVPLSMSYFSLQDKNLQQCFLYCSLYPENFPINVVELIQCWIADGLIDEHPTIRDSFNQGIAWIQHLKDACLVDYDEATGTIKIHDVLRDVAVWLSQTEEVYGFFSQFGFSLREMPKSMSRRVSFMKRRITRLPERILECSQLTVLLLQDNPIAKIPDDFFQELKALRVLNLSNTQITSLPPSFLHLGELRALLLKDCSSLENLSFVEALHKLQVLDISRTGVRAIQRGLGNLHNLRELNLSGTPQLESIEAGTISALSSLEALDMSFSAYNWELKPGSATVNELFSLDFLSVLHIRLDNGKPLALNSIWLKKLRRFSIQISPRSWDSNTHVKNCDEKRLVLRGVNLMEADLDDLLSTTTALDILACGGLGGLSAVVCCRRWLGLASLKSLTIRNCGWMKSLISRMNHRESMLPNVQHIVLSRLTSLRTILDGMKPKGRCLGRLKTLQVTDCPRLTVALSYALLLQVQNLEEIKVSGCARMECVIECGVRDGTLPKLRVIVTRNMVRLRTVFPRTQTWPALQRIEVRNCPRLKNLSLSVCNSDTVKEIRGDLRWWNNLNWEHDNSRNIFQQKFQAYSDEDESLTGSEDE